MRNYINSSDVKKRMSILKEQADCSQITSTRTCYNLYEIANRTKNVNDIIAFYKECNLGSYNADAYLDKCINLMESANNDSRVVSAFQDFVLPIASRSTIAEAYSSEFSDYSDTSRKLLKRQYDYDLAMEQVSEFHNAINGSELIEYSYNQRNKDDMVILHCCNAIDNIDYNLSTAVKAIASVNEAMYVLQETGRQDNTFCVVMEVFDYYGFKFDDVEFTNFLNGLARDPMCKGYYVAEGFENPEETHDLKADIQKEFDKSSKIGLACKKFNSSAKEEADLAELKKSVFRSSIEDIQNNFNLFLDVLFKLSIVKDVEVSKCICDKLLPEVEQLIKDKAEADCNIAREFLLKIGSHVKEAVDKANAYINDRNNIQITENIIYFRNGLTELDDHLELAFDYIYPGYAAECAFNDFISEKDEGVKTTRDFKIFKFNNVVNNCYKIDRFLIKQFNSFKDKFKQKINAVNQKIFEESTVYEMLTDEGNLDYCVTSFDITGIESFREYHDFCTSCIKYINTEILPESGMVCYYQVNPDTLEFRIKENLNLQLSEEDRTLIERSLSIEDINRVDTLLEAAESYSDYNFVEESKKFFKKHPDSDWFNTYLEASAMAGVPKDTIVDIYEAVRDYSGPSFVVGSSYPVSIYTPLKCNINTVLEAVTTLELILEADKPLTDRQKAIRAKKEAQLAQWEKEEEEAENKKNGVKKSSATKKVEKTPEKKEEPKKEKKEKKPINTNNPKLNNALNKASDVADKAVEKAGEGVDKLKRLMTTMKLYVHALRGKMKDLDGKTQTAVRNMDDTVSRLAKGIKQALVSDRREAIIKGSVIPSFHKCLLIAAAEAGLWIINPPIAIIAAVGGFAASKKLTKKERALLYDDIIIEIKILDKEIQRAEDKNQTKKLRQLMRMRKELERQAGRIKYNIRVGKDLIPGGRYINQDSDLE